MITTGCVWTRCMRCSRARTISLVKSGPRERIGASDAQSFGVGSLWGDKRYCKIVPVIRQRLGKKVRNVVSNLPAEGLGEEDAQRFAPEPLYEQFYCARGDMENRIQEQQLELSLRSPYLFPFSPLSNSDLSIQ